MVSFHSFLLVCFRALELDRDYYVNIWEVPPVPIGIVVIQCCPLGLIR